MKAGRLHFEYTVPRCPPRVERIKREMGTFILFYANGHTFRYYAFVFSARSVHSAHEYTKLFTKFEYKERFQK